jgi:hypothetical protein
MRMVRFNRTRAEQKPYGGRKLVCGGKADMARAMQNVCF